MRVSQLRLCAAAFTCVAIAACSGSTGRGVLPLGSFTAPAASQSRTGRGGVTTCTSAKDQPGWIFRGACQTGTIGHKGTAIALDAYKGLTVSGSVAKTNLKKGIPFVVVDATGGRDIGKHGGKSFPKYAVSGSKTLLYLQFVDGGTRDVKIKGRPAIALSIRDANVTPSGDCTLALLATTGSKPSWIALPVSVKVKNGAYSIVVPALPAALSPGAAYLALACAKAPSPTPSPTPTAVPSPTFTQYPLARASSAPMGVTEGPDGNVWFAETTGSSIGKITPSGAITEYAVPNSCYAVIGPYPEKIISGPDGNLWFSAPNCALVEKMSTNGTIQKTYFVPPVDYCSQAEPTSLTAGPDGNVWFTDPECEQIGYVNLTSGTVTTFPSLSSHGDVGDITAGPDGNLWFTMPYYDDSPYAGAIGRITTKGTVSFFPLPAVPGGSAYPAPAGITAGPDGNVWFTFTFSQGHNGGVGSISPSGTIKEYQVGGAWSDSIVKGSDGKLWYTYGGGSSLQQTDNGVGSVTTSGAWVTYGLPIGGHVLGGIAQGADGRFWFADYTGNAIYALGFTAGAAPRFTSARAADRSCIGAGTCRGASARTAPRDESASP